MKEDDSASLPSDELCPHQPPSGGKRGRNGLSCHFCLTHARRRPQQPPCLSLMSTTGPTPWGALMFFLSGLRRELPGTGCSIVIGNNGCIFN